MKRFFLGACAGLLVLAAAAPSLAADMARPSYKAAPAFVAPFSWSGLYVGINGGYGWGWSEWSNAAPMSQGFNLKGGLVGGTLGYNVQNGGWVFGLEGDIDASWIKGSTVAGGGLCAGAGCETRNTWLATGRGRIGYASDRWLPYITGGAAYGSIKMTPTGGPSATDSKFGWTLGGGVEWAITSGWSTKLEYLYVDLGKATCGAADCGIATDVSFKTSIVRAGLNYRF